MNNYRVKLGKHLLGGMLALRAFSASATAQIVRPAWAGDEPLQTYGRQDTTDERRYARGTREIDQFKYADALLSFDEIKTGPRAEGALYWKAYCLNKLGRPDEALQTLAKLRQEHPNSRWADDARVLEAEAHSAGSGQTANNAAADPSNDDIKLMAINGLLAADPERALPQLERLLKGNSSPKLKHRALFVLAQNKSPRAQQILTDLAKGGGNPDLQVEAIRYFGMAGTPEARKQLAAIYSSSADQGVKRSIIQSLMMSHGKEQLFDLARNEKQPDLRREAIRHLGAMRSADELKQLYASETDPSMKREIISGIFVSGDAKSLIDLARKEQDLNLKKQIVSHLSMMHNNKDASEYMMEILK